MWKTPPGTRLLVRKALLGAGCAAALGAVFLMYWRPDMAFDLATRLWSCF